jgi:hypothetical protein
MTIIGLTGKMGSGKDTVGALLIERGYKRLAFADALKATAYDINPIVGVRVTDDGIAFERLQDVVFDFGWEKAKRANPEVRRTLQALGVAARDNVKRSIWVDAALEVIDDEDENIVITDVRFPDEAQMVMHLGGTVYRVVRPGYDGDLHATETALDKYDFPTIDNSGSLEDLAAIVAGIGV